MIKKIDLRSDTVTLPTEEMRKAMYRAAVGDDVYGEDPTVIALQEKGAEMLGKEAGLFVTSGTMGNLTAILAHCQRGDEIILEHQSHIYYYEVGGISAVAGVIPRLICGKNGIFTALDLQNNLRGKNIHFPRTSLVCLENSHNRGGGSVYSLEEMAEIREVCDSNDLSIHLDGARIFNAAIALKVNVKEIAQYADSVMFCLSKGLGSPVGSLLVGTYEWIEKAKKWRKMLGGGLRQAGVLAAAGLVSLDTMVDRLEEDHRNAKKLAEAIAGMDGIEIEPNLVKTNILIFKVDPRIGVENFLNKLNEYGVLANQYGPDAVRFVMHKDISQSDLDETINIMQKITKLV